MLLPAYMDAALLDHCTNAWDTHNAFCGDLVTALASDWELQSMPKLFTQRVAMAWPSSGVCCCLASNAPPSAMTAL